MKTTLKPTSLDDTRGPGLWAGLLCAALFALLTALPSAAFADAADDRNGAPDYLDDSTYEAAEEDIESIYDPLEPFNRVMFTMNDKIYIYVLDPVATGYSKVVPKDFRTVIGNFFYNLGEPVRSVNCLLQGRFADSGLALSRFLINTTAGVFGMADPAGNEFKIAKVDHADLGSTFASWGIGDGFYLVVPLLGPSTLRDFTGSVGDGFARSLYTPPWNDEFPATAALYAGETVNDFSQRLGQYQELKAMTLDPYVAFRNGYAQLRRQSRKTGVNGAEFPNVPPPDFNIDAGVFNINHQR